MLPTVTYRRLPSYRKILIAAPAPMKAGPCCKLSMTLPRAPVSSVPRRTSARRTSRQTFRLWRPPGRKSSVDDLIDLAEPMFQDGIIAQAVDNVVATGVAYFSAAGNEGRQSYQSVFRPGDFSRTVRFRRLRGHHSLSQRHSTQFQFQRWQR